MLPSPSIGQPWLQRGSLLAGSLLAGSLIAGLASAGVQCPQPFEAAPFVPQFRTEAPGQSLWPLGPDGPIFRPASEIPADRNSTNYSNVCDPGVLFGTERFQDVAVLDDNPNWLFVATNSGLSVWDLAANRSNPPRRRMHDGFTGDFVHFPDPGEGDIYVEAVDAITSPSGHAIYVAISGRSGHGMSVWRFDPADNNSLVQIFQEASRSIRDVELANSGGRTYAFASDPGASGGGLLVFDVTEADDLVGGTRCFDDEFQPNLCPNFKGRVGDMTDAGYSDLIEVAGELYVVASDGSALPADGLKVEIWQVVDPARPEAVPTGDSIQKFDGLTTNSRGVQLVRIRGGLFLTVIEVQLSIDQYLVKAYEVTDCLDGDGCGTVGPALWTYQLPPISGNYQYLSASTNGERTFLYYGLESTPSSGSRLEQLFDITDLSRLGGGQGEVYEITDAGAEYLDPVSGEVVDYWGDYYSNNTYGLKNILPRNGRFQGDFFYRAAVGVLDVHRVNLPAPIELFADGFESGDCTVWSAESSVGCQ